MSRVFSNRVATSPGCAPLLQMLRAAEARRASTWLSVEADFLRAMWEFDRNFASGVADQGDNQNGKGDFFNDLICLLLEHCSGKPLTSRPPQPGLIFPRHNLDSAYPPSGNVELLIETKMLGAPKTARNPKQKHPGGRPGSSDLDKRIKEAGLKTIDLKAEAARLAGAGGGPTTDFVSWLHRSRPSCYLLLGVRVVDENDLARVQSKAQSAREFMDSVGVYCFLAKGSAYERCNVSTQLELDRVIARICTQLRNLP